MKEGAFNWVPELASSVGVGGAIAIILAPAVLAVAYKSDKILVAIRNMRKDTLDNARKSRELDHRIDRDTREFQSRIEGRMRKPPKLEGGKK